jgi:alpha-tubulin suppressor-like RCC1 family protein
VPEAAPTGPGPGAGLGGDGDVGEAQFDLTSAPTGAQCIRFSIAPPTGNAIVVPVTITPGQDTSSVSLGILPSGTVTINGNAYGVACSSIGSNAPQWIADPATATIRTGVVTTVALTFRPNNPTGASVNFVPNITGIGAGGYGSFVLTDGAPYVWGTAFGPSATRWTAIGNVLTVATGGNHVCAIKADGTVWCLGSNSSGQCGPGVSTGAYASSPVQVPLPSAAKLITAGLEHTCALVPSGPSFATVYCWGRNAEGELGNGSTTPSSTPVSGVSTGLRSLVAGAYSNVAVTGENAYYAWGADNSGLLGDGGSGNRLTPVFVSESTVQAVAVGASHSCSLRADGSVWCRGDNSMGELGDGTTTNRTTSARVPLPAAAKTITAGFSHSCALLTDGRVACWGYNNDGAIGDLTNTSRSNPTFVTLGGESATALATGFIHNCALTTTLNLWCWGFNGAGAIGDGTYNTAFGPVKATLQ